MHPLRLLVVLWLAFAPLSARADDELAALIDQLTEVREPGIGYSAYFAGSTFLPYSGTEQLGVFVFGGTQRAESDTLRAIVAKGAVAVPTLLEHLGDDRKIAMEPLQGMQWMSFSDEYDYNRRTREVAPEGVNRDDFEDNVEHPDSHAITVGDMCFVALGQIVNRHFSASRYQPSGGMVISSPTYSKRLRDVTVADWKDFTVEKHQQLLTQDFKNPDYETRRVGAYQRLAFYYPELVEPLVVPLLQQPTCDTLVVLDFCRNVLYKAPADQRPELYRKFLEEQGAHYADAVKSQLVEDLDMLEANEEGRLTPRLSEYGSQPRELLIQLFDQPETIRSDQVPPVFVDSIHDRGQLIGSLVHDDSQRIAELVKDLYRQHADDDFFAPECLKCLANRGQDEFLVEQLEGIDFHTLDTSYLDAKVLEAIATSRSPEVRQRLLGIVKETINETYFLHAVNGCPDIAGEVMWQEARRVLGALPANSTQGEGLLALINQKFPDRAKSVFEEFLSAGSAERAGTVCNVLWYGDPLSVEVLGPLLDDKRTLTHFYSPMRVCDRAAQALSHAIDELEFNSDWSPSKRDNAIAKIKKYCETKAQ